MATAIRLSSLSLGLICTTLGCYGAYEFAHALEGRVTYLVLAAPVIAASAALIPPIAEATWRQGAPLKALLWWAAMVPAGAVVFFSSAERVHTAKAGAEAERGAYRSAADRAREALTKATAKFDAARAEANQARGQKQCGPSCRTKLAAEAAAKADVDAASQALLVAEQRATSESPLKAPVWLLPAALDVVAFMAIWTGLTGWSKAPSRETAKRSRRRRKRAGKRRAPKVIQPVNDNSNVVAFPTAH